LFDVGGNRVKYISTIILIFDLKPYIELCRLGTFKKLSTPVSKFIYS